MTNTLDFLEILLDHFIIPDYNSKGIYEFELKYWDYKNGKILPQFERDIHEKLSTKYNLFEVDMGKFSESFFGILHPYLREHADKYRFGFFDQDKSALLKIIYTSEKLSYFIYLQNKL